LEQQTQLVNTYRQTYVLQKETGHSGTYSSKEVEQLLQERKNLEQQLMSAQNKANSLEEQLQRIKTDRNAEPVNNMSSSTSSRLQQQALELISMREKLADQAEQIEVMDNRWLE
jgi:hypothetical protein